MSRIALALVMVGCLGCAAEIPLTAPPGLAYGPRCGGIALHALDGRSRVAEPEPTASIPRPGSPDPIEGAVLAQHSAPAGTLSVRVGQRGQAEAVFVAEGPPTVVPLGTDVGTAAVEWDGAAFGIVWSQLGGKLAFNRFDPATATLLGAPQYMPWLAKAIGFSKSRPGVFGLLWDGDRYWVSAASRMHCLHRRVCMDPEHWSSYIAWIDLDGHHSEPVSTSAGAVGLTYAQMDAGPIIVGTREQRAHVIIGCHAGEGSR